MRETIAGTTGTASTPAFYGRLFNQILQTKTKLIGGYPGQLELLLSMEQGETNAMTSPFWSSLKVQRPTWYPQKIDQHHRSSMARRRIRSSRTCRSRWIWSTTPPTSCC